MLRGTEYFLDSLEMIRNAQEMFSLTIVDSVGDFLDSRYLLDNLCS